MTQSYAKLEHLLISKGFIPRNVYTIDGYCVYIELFCVANTENFLLYISSQFNIKPDKDPIYKLRYVDIESTDNIVSKYAEEPDKNDIKKDYSEVNITDSINNKDIEQSLNDNYNREILLKDLTIGDREVLKDIFRQLSRFTFCVKNIKYKLVILYKNYLSAIKRDDSMECYFINNFPIKDERKIYVSIDLKSFYEKIDKVNVDVKVVKESIFNILNQNHIKHSKILNTMLNSKDSLIYYSDLVGKKKDYYDSYISKIEDFLEKLNENEAKLINEKTINTKPNEYGLKGMHNDIQNSHILFNINSKLQKNAELKEEITQDILKIRSEQENIILGIDKILFDNTVMLNEIINNIKSLTKMLE